MLTLGKLSVILLQVVKRTINNTPLNPSQPEHTGESESIFKVRHSKIVKVCYWWMVGFKIQTHDPETHDPADDAIC